MPLFSGRQRGLWTLWKVELCGAGPNGCEGLDVAVTTEVIIACVTVIEGLESVASLGGISALGVEGIRSDGVKGISVAGVSRWV